MVFFYSFLFHNWCCYCVDCSNAGNLNHLLANYRPPSKLLTVHWHFSKKLQLIFTQIGLQILSWTEADSAVLKAMHSIHMILTPRAWLANFFLKPAARPASALAAMATSMTLLSLATTFWPNKNAIKQMFSKSITLSNSIWGLLCW